MENLKEFKPGIMREDPEAVEKYLFYVQARDFARQVLADACSAYVAGVVHPDELVQFEDELEVLFNELDEAERILYNKFLRH